jgi:hypothetical protein
MLIIILFAPFEFFIVTFFGLIAFLLRTNNSEIQKLDNSNSQFITRNLNSIEPIGISSPVYYIFENNLDN